MKEKSIWSKVFIFILGSLFGLAISFALLNWFLWYVRGWIEWPQTVKLDTNNILTSLKNSMKTFSSWDIPERYKSFDVVWDVLNKQYYDNDKLDFENMMDNALKGYVDAVWDPYTVFMTTEENNWFQEDLKWEKDFEWIWAIVTKKEWWVMVEQVLKWFPAYKAWVKPLDMILEINWEKTKGMTLGEAVSKIRGQKGSKVTLTILRKDAQDILNIEVIRDTVTVPSVLWKVINMTWDINVGYINISIIWEDTEKSMMNFINENKDKWFKGIILDLRWNWGGFLPVAHEIASHFVPEWKVVVTSKYRIYPNETYESIGYWELEDLPVVVLVDWLTASASEIITASLKTNIWAVVVWTKTFGKGSIQTMFKLENDSSLKYTIWKWYTPIGDNVDNVWIEPDVSIELDTERYTKEEYDNQLETAKHEMYKLLNKQK